MEQWFFYGMNGSIPEELQYHSVWNPERPAEELLATIAMRDFRLDRRSALEAVAAWRDLSTAWDCFPYSAMTSGEREAYMRGPWYLGPAHPLIFNEQSHYELAPGFFTRRGDLIESLSRNEIAALSGKPRYVCNTSQLRDVLTDEIANAQRAIPIVEQDPRIGFGHNYGTVYDAEMIRSKIRQCEFVRDKELPRIASIVRFHVWYRYP